MIRTRRQRVTTKREIERLKERLGTLRRKKLSKRMRDLQATSLRKMLRQLQDQVRLYEDAVKGRINRKLLEKLLSPEVQKGRPNFGAAIFILRTAGGMTQAHLARRLGTQQEAIARWERDDYGEYSFETLRRVFGVLGYRLDIRVEAKAG